MINISDQFLPFLSRELKTVDERFTLRCDQLLESGKVRSIDTKLKLKFECPNCKIDNQKSKMNKKVWTSGCGLSMFYYEVQNRKDISFSLSVFSQKCKQCRSAGHIKCYDDEVERLATILTTKVCTELGYKFEKVAGSQR